VPLEAGGLVRRDEAERARTAKQSRRTWSAAIEAERIDEAERVVGDVDVEVDVSSRQPNRIFADEALEVRVVVARPIGT